MPSLETLSGWGRFPRRECEVERPRSPAECLDLIEQPYLARGLGRSYGDAALPPPGYLALDTRRLDRFVDFNPVSLELRVEAGVDLRRILEFGLPRGLFLPVTPGTQHVTLGGAVASNVHGKNHHTVGSIENFITYLEVVTPQGPRACSPQVNPELFRATIGGYGLTGLIVKVGLRLRPVETAYMRTLKVPARNLDHLFRLFRDHDNRFEHSVAWLDCLAQGHSLGRGLLILGEHAALSDLPVLLKHNPLRLAPPARFHIPVEAPGFLLNSLFMKAFNTLYYRFASQRAGEGLAHYAPFFYPLDALSKWNLLYGRRGFFQYQCSIPDPGGEEGIAACLEFLSHAQLGAFLSVLKRCGEDTPMLPFARRGYTLALDIPYRSAAVPEVLDRLDAIVLRYGGRIYLTKDARLKPETFREMYPEYPIWREALERANPDHHTSSRLAERLEIWR